MDKANCEICNHKEHDLGKCKQCNCGENDFTRFSESSFYPEKDFGDYVGRIYDNANVVRYEKGQYKLC